MSRSRKKEPGGGYTSSMSEKQDKRRCNRILRRRSKIRLAIDGEDFMEVMPEQALDVWDMDKDGKQYWAEHDEAWMRK